MHLWEHLFFSIGGVFLFVRLYRQEELKEPFPATLGSLQLQPDGGGGAFDRNFYITDCRKR